MATETVLGVFAHVDTTVRALEELRARGYHDVTVYTPLPVHEIEEVLERDRPVSRLRSAVRQRPLRRGGPLRPRTRRHGPRALTHVGRRRSQITMNQPS